MVSPLRESGRGYAWERERAPEKEREGGVPFARKLVVKSNKLFFIELPRKKFVDPQGDRALFGRGWAFKFSRV